MKKDLRSFNQSDNISENIELFLMVPSHQIRLACRWYGWIGLDDYEYRGWVHEL
jgi:hypothetical protein